MCWLGDRTGGKAVEIGCRHSHWKGTYVGHGNDKFLTSQNLTLWEAVWLEFYARYLLWVKPKEQQEEP
jgi:hypothetical protein